jgi:capsid protein
MPKNPTRPPDRSAGSNDGSHDISQEKTAYLVPRTAADAASVTLITEHRAAIEYLRDLQTAVVQEVGEVQRRSRHAASEELRSIIKRHIEELWEYWRKLENQAADHEQALERLRRRD